MRARIGLDHGSSRLSSPNSGRPPCSMVIMFVSTPGTKAAQPERNVYGRKSEAPFWRKVMVDVANHVSPCRVLSAGQMYSPTPNGVVGLVSRVSVYAPIQSG